MNFLGDVGGVFQVFCWVISFFILPMSYHDYMTSAFRRMYLASTKDNSLFPHFSTAVSPAKVSS